MSWEHGVPPNELDEAQWRAEATKGLEAPRIVGLVGAWMLIGGAASFVVGLVLPPAVFFLPMALAGAWVLSLVAFAQTRRWLALNGSSLPRESPGRSPTRLIGDLVMTLFSATALAPLATASQVMGSYPGTTPGRRRSQVMGARASRIGAWLTSVVGVVLVIAVAISVAWAYQQSQRPDQGPDAWYLFAPMVVGFLGGWRLMVVNGVTALICLSVGRSPAEHNVRLASAEGGT